MKRLHAYLVLKESGSIYRNAVAAFRVGSGFSRINEFRFFDSLESGL
jgi:hypothetical protein